MAKWRCAVCGYDHVDGEPPPHCPVCGSDRSRFSAVEAAEEKGSGAETLSAEPTTTKSQRWQCTVCGTIHTGAGLPDECPVCGTPSSHFSSVDSKPIPAAPQDVEKKATKEEEQRWQCGVCGYVYSGPEPPQNCPVCGAEGSLFVLLEAQPKPAATRKSEKPAAPDQAQHSVHSAPSSLFEPYRRWIDLAIDYHAHPIAVHIPNGVLPVTVVMVLLAGLFDWPAIGRAGVYNMGFIFLSMPLVLFNGYLTWQFKFGGNLTNLFKWKIVCGAVVFLLSLILFAWGLASPNAAQAPGGMYLLLHLVLLGAAVMAGWLGGKLVFHQ